MEYPGSQLLPRKDAQKRGYTAMVTANFLPVILPTPGRVALVYSTNPNGFVRAASRTRRKS
jgi:hypothetical protein